MLEKIIVSACLLGEKCRYDGNHNYEQAIVDYVKEYKVIPVCPEVLGGLCKNGRTPCEIINGRVIDKHGIDKTKEYQRGAQIVSALVETNHVKKAIMKSKSPSCGVNQIYDGTFSGSLIEGKGICVKALTELGVQIYDSDDIITQSSAIRNKKKL